MESLEATDPASVGGYPLLRRLGAGGMGQVYLSHTRAGRPIALKTVRSELGLDPAFGERFAREIRHADRVRSPWTVTVVDFSPAGARPPWLATEYVAAPSLADWVAGHGPLPPESLTALAAELCGALQAVHQTGLAHRDVKPSNVLLAATRPLLIDFGIARAAEDSRLTSTGGVIGSPGYMAPEQATEGMSTESGDVFALGAVLVYAATGRGPFSRPGENASAALLYRVVHEEPGLDGVPEALLPLMRACLAKRPEDRPTARAAAELLAGPNLSAALWAQRQPPGLPAELALREADMLAALGDTGVVSPAPSARVVTRHDTPRRPTGVPLVPSPDAVTRTARDSPARRGGPVPTAGPDPASEDDLAGRDTAGPVLPPKLRWPARRGIVPFAAVGVLAAAALTGLLVHLLGAGSDHAGSSGGTGASGSPSADGRNSDPSALPASWVGTWAGTGPGNPNGNYSLAQHTDSYKITLTLHAGRLNELVGRQVSDVHDQDTGENDGCTEDLWLKTMDAGTMTFAAGNPRPTDPDSSQVCRINHSYVLSMAGGTLQLLPGSQGLGAPTTLTRR
ncbi:serine/threonine-protein kinase [Streptomyces sp. IBSBF 2435]|uniref:serine/threonine-protein kinase n=1 Tax=Streptomyces sp. IBSBF 2435 TaxID=2903531 RepID=UPI002FDBA6E0